MCEAAVIYCGACNSIGLVLVGQEIEDIQSAISFFIKDYKGAPNTKKSLNRIMKNCWKAIKEREV